ncbi:hypothetical protein QQ045_015783 [Rhodiola kirilowii]
MVRKETVVVSPEEVEAGAIPKVVDEGKEMVVDVPKEVESGKVVDTVEYGDTVKEKLSDESEQVLSPPAEGETSKAGSGPAH